LVIHIWLYKQSKIGIIEAIMGIVELTNRIYKITLLFPKKEPLRYKIREAADDVLKSLAVWEVCASACSDAAISGRRGDSAGFCSVDILGKERIAFELKKDFNILKKYFEIAKWQNWIGYFDILEIEEEYDKIMQRFEREVAFLSGQEQGARTGSVFEWQEKQIISEIKEQDSQSKKLNQKEDIVVLKEEIKNNELDPRKEKILDFLKERGKVQVWEIKKILPDVSKRTLRRDFDKLLKLKIVERIGERNETFYRLTA